MYQLSIVIPAFNEVARIQGSLRRIDTYLRERGLSSEVIVMDDDSTDGTADVVRAISRQLSVPVIVDGSRVNRGKGYAVKSSIEHATGRAILMTDADRTQTGVSHPPVRWRDAPGTKVHRRRDAARALWGIARIRWNAIRGRYDTRSPSTEGPTP